MKTDKEVLYEAVYELTKLERQFIALNDFKPFNHLYKDLYKLVEYLLRHIKNSEEEQFRISKKTDDIFKEVSKNIETSIKIMNNKGE